MATCTGCGAPVGPGWRFCAACGTVAEPTPPSAMPAAAPPASRWRRPVTTLTAIAVIVAVVALSGVGAIAMNVRTSNRLDDTRDELAVTEVRLAKTKRTLGKTKKTLAARTRQRDKLSNTLEVRQQELAGVQGQLVLAEGNVDAFRTCINGIDRAIDYELQGDSAAAEAAYRSVESECDKADRLL